MIGLQTSGGPTRCLFVTDSHCHLRSVALPPDVAVTDEMTDLPFTCAIRNAVVCGTHPDIDWKLVEAVVQFPERRLCSSQFSADSAGGVVVPGFGIHPWFVPHGETQQSAPSDNGGNGFSAAPSACGCSGNSAGGLLAPGQQKSAEELLHLLEDFLLRYPLAIVGEIGLDKLRGPPEEVQLSFFLAQMQLAARYARPVSVHCVRSFGVMLKALQGLSAEDTPPAIVLHGFTGSLEFARSAMMIRKRWPTTVHGCRSLPKPEPLPIFFGVGASTSLRVKGFLTQTLPFLLQNGRMLLETDAHHTILGDDNPTLGTEVGDDVRRGGLLWNTTGCMQLAQLMAQVSGGDRKTAETLLKRCEESFARAFRRP